MFPAADALGSFLHGLSKRRVGVDVASDFLCGEVDTLCQRELRQELGDVGSPTVSLPHNTLMAFGVWLTLLRL